MPALGGPPLFTPLYTRVDQLNKLVGGAAITYFDLIGLTNYSGTVTSVTPGKQIVINSPNGGGSLTFPLAPMDSALALPIGVIH